MGDFRAQIAAVKTGERRFLDMVRKYGRDAVLDGIEAIMDQSEAVARARVQAMPDGVYEAESFMDDDGINVGQRVPITRARDHRGRPHDGRPLGGVEAGAGLLQFRASRPGARAARWHSSA